MSDDKTEASAVTLDEKLKKIADDRLNNILRKFFMQSEVLYGLNVRIDTVETVKVKIDHDQKVVKEGEDHFIEIDFDQFEKAVCQAITENMTPRLHHEAIDEFVQQVSKFKEQLDSLS